MYRDDDLDDLLGGGFHLALFIIRDRSAAIEILGRALNKVAAQRGYESRRAYWRDKYLKRGITRITRGHQDTLQWLIYYESEVFEKMQEQFHEATSEDMVIRYVKTLVRLTTAMSSFYVNLGVRRLLYNYSTSETQRVYELVSERYPGDDEYRRAKGQLMQKLEGRFGKFLRTLRAQRGEVRFELFENQGHWGQLVRDCLQIFTPWSTWGECRVPSDFNPAAQSLPHELSGRDHAVSDQDTIEINRCHAFLDPVCQGRLSQALNLDLPDSRLAVPRFFMDKNSSSTPKWRQKSEAPEISARERKLIRDRLSVESARRFAMSPRSLKITVDGENRLEMNLPEETETQFLLERGDKLIEIWVTDNGERVLLATHLIRYDSLGNAVPTESAFFFRGGEQLKLAVSPGESGEVRVQLNYVPVPQVVHSQALVFFQRTAVHYTLLGILAAVLGWFAGSGVYRQELAGQKARLEQLTQALDREKEAGRTQPTAPAVVSFRLVPDEYAIRTGGAGSGQTVVPSSSAALLNLELSVEREDRKTTWYQAVLKQFGGSREITCASFLNLRQTASGPIVVFPVPSDFVQANQNYMVELKSLQAGGAWKETSSFSFHVTQPNR